MSLILKVHLINQPNRIDRVGDLLKALEQLEMKDLEDVNSCLENLAVVMVEFRFILTRSGVDDDFETDVYERLSGLQK